MKNYLILLLLLFGLHSCDIYTDCESAYKEYFLSKEFSGIIDSVYNDPESRNSPYVKVRGHSYNVLRYNIEFISQGDSIVKQTGTMKLILYKKDVEEPVILKPKCDGREFE